MSTSVLLVYAQWWNKMTWPLIIFQTEHMKILWQLHVTKSTKYYVRTIAKWFDTYNLKIKKSTEHMGRHIEEKVVFAQIISSFEN